MTKAELLAAARGKPLPFEFSGFACFLLPLPWGEMKDVQGKHKEGDDATAEAMTFEFVARAVCDESGARLLDPSDVPQLPLSTIRALSEEIARRSGVGADSGKA